MAFQYGMLMQLSITLLVVLVLAATHSVARTRASARQGEEDEIEQARPGCKDTCGNLTIPYPFGIGDGCYFRPEFNITCIESNHEHVPTEPRLMKTRMIVTNLSLEEGELQIRQLVNRVCYDDQGKANDTQDQSKGGLSVIPPYTISGAKNMLVAVGCDTYVRFVGSRDDQKYITGCLSQCQHNISGNAIDKNDSCSGMGCCETKIPPVLNNLKLKVFSFRNHSRVWDFNPCGYAFVVQKGNFTFSNTSFQQLRNTTRLPLVLDWQIGETSCESACKANNSYCHNKTSGVICRCSTGFQGNPYLENSCKDIDECALNSTRCGKGKCINQVGNYTCSCDSGYKNEDNKCIEVHSAKRLKISLGVSLSFSVLVVAIFWIYRKHRKSHVKNLKRTYFKANGGALLEKKMSKMGKTARIFTESEVKEATNNYDNEKNKVGEGSYAIVYRGILDKQVVAIKKSKVGAQINQNQSTVPPDQNQNTAVAQEQSVDEMTVLYQINHNNVVRLVGCCLESQTPIMVYEFISNGTLYEYIHGKEGEKPPSRGLKERLEIAAETAGALAYLHHDTFMPVIHGDVKTANILLHKKDKNDEKLTPKLSNFKASRLVPKDENQGSPLDHGAEGYVDPESKSKSLTEKSDVYSFGVVLAELLTSQMAISPEKPEAERELANVFVSKVKQGRLDEILDKEIGHSETVTKAADLAKRCLRLRREERPSMREVAAELQGLVRTMEQHPSGGEAKDAGILVASSNSVVDSTTSAECESSMITPL